VFLRERGVLDPAPDPAFDRWTVSLRRGSGAAVAALCLSDESHRFVKSVSVVGAAPAEVQLPVHLPLSGPLEEHLLRFTSPTRARPHTYAEAPVLTGGRVVGQVAIAGAGPQGWHPDAVDLLHDSAAALSAQLALRLAKAEIERVQQLVASHHTVHDMIARAVPLDEVLTEICETIQRYDPAVIPCVLLLDPATRTLHSGIGPALPAEYLAATEGVTIGPNIGTCAVAAWYGRRTVSPDLENDPSWAPIIHLARMADVASCWSTPIKDSEGEVMGTLAFYGRQPREPVPEHLALMDDWGRVAGIAIERSRTQDRLTHDACHDGLTGLPNRRAIFVELEEAIQRATPERPAAVLFVDLDGLKALNDTHGHDRADEMIRDIALRLAATVGDEGFVGRFGGDEFIVIAEGVPGPESAEKLGGKLLGAVAEPLPGLNATVMTASVGVTLVRSDAVEAREAIRRADAAMYSAKRSGRDRCVIAGTGCVVHEGRRLRLARELRGVETRGELSLVYQPVVALPTMEVVGVEALLRWTSPTLGTVAPSEFVPVAEDTGSIVPIGAWAMRESCEAMALLSQEGQPLELGVNVSACQVAHPDFPLWVRRTLFHAQFPAHLLGLEITETALMRPGTLTAQRLGELDELGVRLVLDDFGTGYSSLTWLKQHRFGSIKIDHSFVRGLPDDPGDRAIVAGVIGMARALGSGVTAEGVETEGQLAALQTLGCERVQGFLLMEPVGAAELPGLIKERRPAFR
jgi:diguanylate cyclase (GGDEF)-like protein